MSKLKELRKIWKIKRRVRQKKREEQENQEIIEPEYVDVSEVKLDIVKHKIVHHFRRNKDKLMMDILNTMITLIVGGALLGIFGIFIALIPDIMLVFIISDLWQKDPEDKLIGWKLEVHLLLHSIWLIVILFISLFIIMVTFAAAFWIVFKIIIILVVHVIIDQLTHDPKRGGHFRGYSRINYKKPVDTEVIEE